MVASCAAPAIPARLRTRMSGLLGEKTAGMLFMGLSAMKQGQQLGPRQKKKARGLEKRLVERG